MRRPLDAGQSASPVAKGAGQPGTELGGVGQSGVVARDVVSEKCVDGVAVGRADTVGPLWSSQSRWRSISSRTRRSPSLLERWVVSAQVADTGGRAVGYSMGVAGWLAALWAVFVPLDP